MLVVDCFGPCLNACSKRRFAFTSTKLTHKHTDPKKKKTRKITDLHCSEIRFRCFLLLAALSSRLLIVNTQSPITMLSRFIRSVPVRRFGRVAQSRAFSVTIDADGKTDAELLASISEIPNVGTHEPVLVAGAGENAFTITSVDDAGLIDGLAQTSVDAQEEEEEGFLDAIGLGPFHRKASVIATGALTALSNEFYVLNEETFVAACLISGFTVMHVLLREPILEAYETFQRETLAAQQEVRSLFTLRIKFGVIVVATLNCRMDLNIIRLRTNILRRARP